MAEITVLGAAKAPFTLYWGPQRPIFIFMLPASSFIVKMWPSNEIEFDTPDLDEHLECFWWNDWNQMKFIHSKTDIVARQTKRDDFFKVNVDHFLKQE